MRRSPRDANSCTIELVTGAFIEVAESPGAVMDRRYWKLAEGELDLMKIVPLIGSSRADSDWRQAVWVDPKHIAAVFPLDERSIPPRRVYVDRVEAHSKT